ncbi:hypothetical protein [Ruminococcus flavefaciens]|uniref:hypothetical protein n=1 Tax=Ruminococcus flavefaciens TaxID=1265 RepID=UPI0026EEC920|nr:hypothetical protein [Ruminococcus flavefaciens]
MYIDSISCYIDKYCVANKPDDSDYVILPVSNFDAYFGNTSFSHKWLNLFPDTLLEREKQSFGVCRVRRSFTRYSTR